MNRLLRLVSLESNIITRLPFSGEAGKWPDL